MLWNIRNDYLRVCMDTYYDAKDAFIKNHPNLDDALQNAERFLGELPEAKAFLSTQKDFWHKLSLIGLHRQNRFGSHFENAGYFLYQVEANNDKQKDLLYDLSEYYEIARKVGTGGEAVSEFIRQKGHNISWIEETAHDQSFLSNYRKNAELYWLMYAGLWPHRIPPEDAKTGKMFYSGVSDFMLCMIDGISQIEEMVTQQRKLRIN